MLIKMESLNRVRNFLSQLLNGRPNKAVATINQTIELNDTTTNLINLKLAQLNIDRA
ncbi:MAG: hypothetical protein JWR05_2274 [Mucilaginibacter sp.]|nr:hypothetical protein [Mucilaginibacter sp.]